MDTKGKTRIQVRTFQFTINVLFDCSIFFSMPLPQNQHINQMNNLMQRDCNHRVATERRNEGKLLNAVIACFTLNLNFPI